MRGLRADQRFTDDLGRSLTDFVTNTSDEEFRRGLLEADYDYYSNVESVAQMTRLQVYDQLRKMHALLKDVPIRDDEWENCVIDAVDRVLYLAESEFARILPAPVLAEPEQRLKSAKDDLNISGEARESTIHPQGKTPQPKGEPDSRGGQKPFDKKTYQREYMRKKRAK